MDGGFVNVNLDPERNEWETRVIGAETTRAWMSQEGQGVDDQAELHETARGALDAFFAAGWPTADAPDWVTGGYATKERMMSALRLLADRIDDLALRLTGLEIPPMIQVDTETGEVTVVDEPGDTRKLKKGKAA